MGPRLIDSNLWVDFFRKKTPRAVRELIKPWILDPGACLGEPISYEVLGRALKEERQPIRNQFATLPILATPKTLWADATQNGQTCRDQGVTPGSLDLLIATLAIHHDAELVTFDTGFTPVANCLPLRLRLLTRPEA